MKSAPGEGPEAQLIKNDRFYMLFGFTIAKYTAKNNAFATFLDLKTASRRGPWVGPNHNKSKGKTKTCWICDRAKSG